jgi:hypothetical protein
LRQTSELAMLFEVESRTRLAFCKRVERRGDP